MSTVHACHFQLPEYQMSVCVCMRACSFSLVSKCSYIVELDNFQPKPNWTVISQPKHNNDNGNGSGSGSAVSCNIN